MTIINSLYQMTWEHVCNPGFISQSHPCSENEAFTFYTLDIMTVTQEFKSDYSINCYRNSKLYWVVFFKVLLLKPFSIEIFLLRACKCDCIKLIKSSIGYWARATLSPTRQIFKLRYHPTDNPFIRNLYTHFGAPLNKYWSALPLPPPQLAYPAFNNNRKSFRQIEFVLGQTQIIGVINRSMVLFYVIVSTKYCSNIVCM